MLLCTMATSTAKEMDRKRQQHEAVYNELYMRIFSQRCRDLRKENANLKVELEKTNNNIKILSEKSAIFELQMNQLKERLRKRNENANSNKIDEEEPALKMNLDENCDTLEKQLRNRPETDDIDTPGNVIKLNVLEAPVSQHSDTFQGNTTLDKVEILEELLLNLPVESLRELEEDLVCGIMELSKTLQKLEKSKVRHPSHQNIKNDLLARMVKMQTLRRRLLTAIYTLRPSADKSANNEEQSQTTSGNLLLDKHGANENGEYFRNNLVIPRLNLDGDDYKNQTLVVNTEYHFPEKMMATKKKNKFAKGIESILSFLTNTFGKKNSKNVEIGCNDVNYTLSDISVMSRTESMERERSETESCVPRLDLSGIESPRPDTSSIPFCVSLLSHTDRFNTSSKHRTVNAGRPLQKKSLFARLRSAFRGKNP